MQTWELIRLRCVRDGEPIKRVARELGLAPNTVRKYVRDLSPPGPPRYERANRLDPFAEVIDSLLRAEPRITAKRIGTLLRERYDEDLRISPSTLRKYVAACRMRTVAPEAFVRALYQPGDQAQFDFSPMRAVIGGVDLELDIFAMRLSYSAHFFARAFLRCDRPALFAGLLGALRYFGGLPNVAVFDNAKTAITKVLRGRRREQNAEFSAFCGALALEVVFAAPAKGNEKGGVEGLMGYIEDNFFRPIPSFDRLADLNATLERFCTAELRRIPSTQTESVAELFARERPHLRPLPERLPDPCIRTYARVNKFAEVTVETNRYSVPTRLVHRHATIELSDERVVIFVDGERVAEHRRAQGKRQAVIDPLHYVELIARKHRSATRALAFAGERLPKPLMRLYDRLAERDEATATKTWTAILRLALQSSLEALTVATEVALARGTLDPEAIALLLRQRDQRVALPVLDLGDHAPGPARRAQDIDLAAYTIANLVECAR
ncbi:IS21 family transposase [bacterium]|nr:MAG: IS21 family transposase [bacterium]